MAQFHLSKKVYYGKTIINSVVEATNSQGKVFTLKNFNKQNLEKYDLQEALVINEQALEDLDSHEFPEHILEMMERLQNDQFVSHLRENYSYRLDQYCQKNIIAQNQALKIFDHVLKGVASLFFAGYLPQNIRLEHFVLVGKKWKLQSFVANNKYLHMKGQKSQYVFDPTYQPPETYGEKQISNEGIKQAIVWNLGSLLLDLLIGFHKLKDLTTIDKFKNELFTFEKIGISKKKQFSQQIEQVLGQMLHYDCKKRSTLKNVFLNSFLCREVADFTRKKYPKVNQEKKIQIKIDQLISPPKSSIQSKSRILKKSVISEELNNQITSLPKQSSLYGSQIPEQNEGQVQNDEIFTQKIGEISKIQSKKKNKNLSSINNIDIQKSIQLYKTTWDKCQLLQIASQKLTFISFKNNQQENLFINQYAINFVALMNLNDLILGMNSNLNVLQMQPDLWSQFQSTSQYDVLKKMYNCRVVDKQNKLDNLRKKILSLQNKTISNQEDINKFLMMKYQHTQFTDIKKIYRKILKISYDLLTESYNQKKQSKLGRLAIYVVYCMTIDKMYIKQDIMDNFEHFFQYYKKQPEFYISVKQFQDYIEKAPVDTLVLHSKKILSKYFKI